MAIRLFLRVALAATGSWAAQEFHKAAANPGEHGFNVVAGWIEGKHSRAPPRIRLAQSHSWFSLTVRESQDEFLIDRR
jgi:hypothetical protein